MATVIERPDTTRTVREDHTVYRSDDSSGWAIALIVLVVLALIALFAWPGLANRTIAPAATPNTIQVNVPEANPTPVAPTTPTNNLPVDDRPVQF
jgi:hypothetical protein